LRAELALRRFDLASWTEVAERLAVRRLVALNELWDLDAELLGPIGGNRTPLLLRVAVAVVADLAPPLVSVERSSRSGARWRSEANGVGRCGGLGPRSSVLTVGSGLVMWARR